MVAAKTNDRMRRIGYLYFVKPVRPAAGPIFFSRMKVIKHFIGPRPIWTSGFLLLLLGLCGGCGSGVRRDGHKVFSYNESDGIATLDPAFAKNRSIMWAIHQLYSTLVETDNQLHFVPGLAKSWEVSPDRRLW